jgi:hypothetical protein
LKIDSLSSHIILFRILLKSCMLCDRREQLQILQKFTSLYDIEFLQIIIRNSLILLIKIIYSYTFYTQITHLSPHNLTRYSKISENLRTPPADNLKLQKSYISTLLHIIKDIFFFILPPQKYILQKQDYYDVLYIRLFSENTYFHFAAFLNLFPLPELEN